jgi:hypothetical protein
MSIRTAAAIAAFAIAGSAAAQVAPVMPVPVPTLSVSAEGKSLRAPDVAEMSGGVVTVAKTAAAAMAENATRMSAVVAAVRKAGVAERDIQTAGISLQPQYRYDQNQPPVLTGYQATNTVSLRLRKLPDVGRLLDTLVSVGANQINGPNFRVDNSDAAMDEARLAAVAAARARGDLYAKAAGVRIKRILTISESGGYEPPRPMMMMRGAAKMEADTPVVPGEVALTVTVNVTFEIE